MKKRSILITALSLVLVAALSIGGTMAYFTATSGPKTNTFTVGNIDIELEEPNFDSSKATNLTPSVEVGKDPAVKNIGKNPCYVRLKITGLTCTNNELASAAGLYAVGEELGAGKSWFYDSTDNCYYYTKILSPDKTSADNKTKPLFTAIGLSSTALEDSAAVSAPQNIVITAEAIQCEGALKPANPAAPTAAEIKAAFAAF